MPLLPLAIADSAVRVLGSAAGPAPARLTLDELRSDLSHETAAKLARLAGLLREWRVGRFRGEDPADAAAILYDIDRLHVRHARVASGRMRSFAQLVRVVALAHTLRRGMSRAHLGTPPAAAALARLERDLGALRAASRHLVETLSARYGARFGELVGAAAEEIRREAAATNAHGVPVVIDSADGGVAAWVPRADAAPWSDLLRNFVRNAVQATEERRIDGTLNGPPPVTVRLRPAPQRGGACVEIADKGVGMTPVDLEAMWGDGRSRHGDGHGQGLTAGKRAFLEQRAALEVRSAPGVGTGVRIELAHRDVVILPPHRWAAPPLVLPAAMLLVGLFVLVTQASHPPLASVEVRNDRLVFALDARGRVLWQREFAEGVAPNWHSQIQTPEKVNDVNAPYLVLRGRGTGGPLVILASRATQAPGRVIALDARGRDRWSHTLRWIPPHQAYTGNLAAVFETSTVWNEGMRPTIALNVRVGNWSSTTIQFFSPQGDSLGAYYHPGQLEYLHSGDVDGDGRVELVLNGKNNDAPYGTAFWPGDPGSGAYGECLILLETPHVNGQGFPYRRWDGMTSAREEAYLLIPPLREESFTRTGESDIMRMSFGTPNAAGEVRSEVYMQDGRIYQLDGRLRPISCSAGDRTTAAELVPTHAAAPLLYLREGRIESIDVPVQRGT